MLESEVDIRIVLFSNTGYHQSLLENKDNAEVQFVSNHPDMGKILQELLESQKG